MSGPYRTPEAPQPDEQPPPTAASKRPGLEVGGRLVPFDEIDAIHYDFDGLIPGPPRVELVTFDGERITLPEMKDLDLVLEALDRHVTRPITRRAKEALAGGQRLVFGPLALELEGITLKDKPLSWASLSRVEAERDVLVFYSGTLGRFGWVRVSEIPHPKALLELLRMRTRVVMSGSKL